MDLKQQYDKLLRYCYMKTKDRFLALHATKSSTITMAVQTGVLFAGLFNVPAKMATLAKIWQLRPTMALYEGTFCNMYRYGRLKH